MRNHFLSGTYLHRLSAGLLCALIAARSVKAATPMQEYVEAMQPGWNLGNSLDATPTETSWGNPLATQELIQQVAAQGYKSIRIPVTWEPYMGDGPDYTIDPAWMDRVQQVVDRSLDAGLYVMAALPFLSEAPRLSTETSCDSKPVSIIRIL